MRKFRRIEAGSYYSYLPEGCRLCRRGSKLVLFVTGKCMHSCFYCPISKERSGRDVIYANERKVRSIEDFLEEAELMGADGVAITGGEPLLKIERVAEFLKIAKELDMHVHLYTSLPAGEEKLRKLRKLDEIRFHPPELLKPEAYADSIRAAKKLGMDAGFEIPALRFDERIVEIANDLDAFLNVNQLEVSETNWREIVGRGYAVKDYYVETPEVIKAYEKASKFHYCSARFKDVAQFRRRLIRMAMNHPEFYEITGDGTVVCCRIDGNLDVAEYILSRKGIKYVRFEDCIETSPELDEEIREALKSEGLKLSLVERYPTFNRMVVDRIEI
ncbi:radical SAM protein [Archaeoglobus neptunius]|uniref:radical SAM protein n=1 Tax=Archaeoglobus neptunius TaxID=2798580 RepID=UPI001926372C|nr:radical SAM protein [Archaeoglobus neptunius]